MSYRRRRRNDLTLADKVEVINLVDEHTSQTDVAKIYDCSQSQISRIVSKRDEILAEWDISGKPDRKRRRSTREDTSEKRGESKRAASSSATQTQKDPAAEQHHDSDSASANGWSLFYWKDDVSHGHQGTLPEMDSESSVWSRHYSSGGKRGRGRPKASANMESRISNQLLDILKSYDLCDVYCADEFGLHYAALPGSESKKDEESAAGSAEKSATANRQQPHVTVFLACNVTGADKRDPLIIEDSNLGCFHGASGETADVPGCQRAKAPNAWMTADIFKEYLLALDHAMRQQKRYILLLVDNIPPHIPEAGRMLEHVRVLYIRSYATPFFHGIFYSVRSHYRKQVVLKMVASTHGNSSTGTRGRSRGEKQKGIPSQTVDISLPEALKMLQLAWQSVSPQDVVPCFSRAGICAPYIHGLPEPKVEELPDLPDGFITSEQFEDYVNFDTDVECSGNADLLSAECRILSDLRQQGYTDIGKEDYDDQSLDSSLAHTRSFSAPGDAHAGASSVKMTPNAGALVAAARQDKVGNAEAMGALGVLRSFLDQQNLPLHNLCALEAQIYEYVRQSNA